MEHIAGNIPPYNTVASFPLIAKPCHIVAAEIEVLLVFFLPSYLCYLHLLPLEYSYFKVSMLKAFLGTYIYLYLVSYSLLV